MTDAPTRPTDPEVDPDTAVQEPPPAIVKQRRFWHWAWRVLMVVGVGLAVYELEGNWGELELAGSQLGHLNLTWVLVGGILEIASYLSYSLSQVRLLRAGGARPGTVPVTQQAFAAQAVQNCMPAGTAAGLVFSYRAFRRMKVDEGLSAWVILVNNVMYVGALCVIVLVAAWLAGKARNPAIPDLRPYAGGVLALLLILVGAGVVLHRQDRLASLTHRAARRLGLLRRHRDGALAAEHVIHRLTALSARRSDVGTCTLLLTLAWLCDAACLGVAFPAVGATTPVRGLLIAYAAAQLATAAPVTPGGLGLVEGSLTLALVAYGGTGNATLAAVLLYRILSYWSIMPLGLVSYLFLRRRPLPADALAAA